MLEQLPDSCEASAGCLERQRHVYEQYGVFSPSMIDGMINSLCGYADANLRRDIDGNEPAMLKLVKKYFHCG